MKPIVANESMTELLFPDKGLDTSLSFYDGRRNDTTQVGTNVRLYESITQRGRGGSRAGLGRYLDAQPSGAHLIQHLATIVRVDGAATMATFSVPGSPPGPQSFPGGGPGLPPVGPEPFPGGEWRVPGTVPWDFNPPAERFYPGDPSQPSESGWSYTGDPNHPVAAENVGINGPGDYFLDPSTGPGPGRQGGDPIPVGGAAVQPPVGRRKIRPKITWDDPASIVFPTPLTAVQLNAVARHPETFEAVRGTYNYAPAKNTVLAVGVARPLRVVFVPTDINKFFPARNTRTIDVTTYSYGSTSHAGLQWPNKATILYQWGTYSWASSASLAIVGTNPDIAWTIAGLPSTLVDLNNGDDNGKIVILSDPVLSKLYWYSSGAVYYFGLDYRYGGLTRTGYFTDFIGSGTPDAPTSQNPLAWTITLEAAVTLAVAGGTTETHNLTVTVSAPAV